MPVWLSANIFSVIESPTLFGAGLMAFVIVHLVLLVLSITVLLLALWSMARIDREWKWQSFVAVALASAYLGLSFYVMGT